MYPLKAVQNGTINVTIKIVKNINISQTNLPLEDGSRIGILFRVVLIEIKRFFKINLFFYFPKFSTCTNFFFFGFKT
jgi:hypothetical protein